MANEVARLVFEADTKQLKKAQKQLDKVSDSADDVTASVKKSDASITNTGRSIRGFSRDTDAANDSQARFSVGLGGVVVAITAVAGAVLGASTMINAWLNKVEEAGASFSILNARLVTATGGLTQAKMAFADLNEFALRTPFTLDEAVNGFAKMKNLGLDPTKAAMTSFANTAAAMGKSLEQMVEAVADATTGEFERLKEFGIKSAQQGDQVTFTFRGVKKTIQKESQLIQEYLENIGSTVFADAAIEQTRTLAGSISNLEQAYSILRIEAGELAGANDILAKSNNSLAAAITAPKYVEGLAILTSKWASFKAGVVNATQLIKMAVVDSFTRTEQEYENLIETMQAHEQRLKDEGKEYGQVTRAIERQIEKLRELQELKGTGEFAEPDDESGTTGGTAAEKITDNGENPFEFKKGDKESAFGSEMDEEVDPFEALLLKEERLRELRLEAYELQLSDDEAHKEAVLKAEEEHANKLEKIESIKDKTLFSMKKKASGMMLNMLQQRLTQGLGDSKAAAVAGVAIGALGAGAQIMIEGMMGSQAIRAGHQLQASFAPDPATQAGILAKGETLAAANMAASKTMAATAMAVKFGTGLVGVALGGGGGGGSSGGGVSGESAANDANALTDRVGDDEGQAVAPQQEINITVDGSIDPSGARRIIEAINEATADGLEINALVGT